MKEIKTPYEAGFDAGVNSPNEDNCNYSWFNTPENTKQWEMGNKAGLNTRGFAKVNNRDLLQSKKDNQ